VNGVNRLMFRVANERRSAISEARMNVVLTNDEDDGDGVSSGICCRCGWRAIFRRFFLSPG
jgi:hypothetical protein